MKQVEYKEEMKESGWLCGGEMDVGWLFVEVENVNVSV